MIENLQLVPLYLIIILDIQGRSSQVTQNISKTFFIEENVLKTLFLGVHGVEKHSKNGLRYI